MLMKLKRYCCDPTVMWWLRKKPEFQAKVDALRERIHGSEGSSFAPGGVHKHTTDRILT